MLLGKFSAGKNLTFRFVTLTRTLFFSRRNTHFLRNGFIYGHRFFRNRSSLKIIRDLLECYRSVGRRGIPSGRITELSTNVVCTNALCHLFLLMVNVCMCAKHHEHHVFTSSGFKLTLTVAHSHII